MESDDLSCLTHEDYPQKHGCPSMGVGTPFGLVQRNWVSHEGGGDHPWTCPQRNWVSHEGGGDPLGLPTDTWSLSKKQVTTDKKGSIVTT